MKAYIARHNNSDYFLVVQMGAGSVFYPISSWQTSEDIETEKVSEEFEIKEEVDEE